MGIDAQIEAMAARWPTFAVTARDDRSATWVGTLDPVQRRYRVRITYAVPFAIERFAIIDVQPRVQVLSPRLEMHPDYDEGPVPHVYGNRSDRSLPFICLFDPYEAEWSPSDLLSETTIPWTSRYLYFYEGWLATGVWRGGGRHPTAQELGDDGGKAIAAV